MEINKREYTKLIQEDLDFLNKNLSHLGNSLELEHIKVVLWKSIDILYKTK